MDTKGKAVKGARRANTPEERGATSDAIIDNTRRRVGDFLRLKITDGADLSIVSAYFTIYAYDALRDALEQAGRTRFLYGEPTAVGALDPRDGDAKSFRLNKDGGITLRQALAQKPLAKTCAEWIEKQVEIRTIAHANFLHGKLYHVGTDEGSAAVAGSSNFTVRGLGFGATPNLELNLEIRDGSERTELLDWFNRLWTDTNLTRDAKSEVLAALERLGQPYAPQFVYYKTLFHVFEDWIARHGERDDLLEGVHLHDTDIWKALYAFQRDGVTSAINRLLRHNGCIVADSVGLGKTWTALAVIKFFELRNERVLVLCPKRLEENWIRYTAWAAYRNNPFESDRLNYSVLAHTDLSRYEGRAGNIDLARFNWGAFDLIVIDESHNFRNEGTDRKNEAGVVIRRSRYNRLLEDALGDGVRTKVLMLSATPVNTSLRDLRNQIYLMTEKRQDAFREALGIGNIQSMFGIAQREFQNWERERRAGTAADKTALLEGLGSDFLSLLDAVTLARSRDHVRRFYPEVTAKIGGFPERQKPKNLYPRTDRAGELAYDDLHEQIGSFRLAVYQPSQYLLDSSGLEEERLKRQFDQRDRERFLIGMMRVNFLKRLESSVHSFTRTMERLLKKMEDLDKRIAEYHAQGTQEELDFGIDMDEEDEEFVVGRGRKYQLSQIDLGRWQQDLNEDWDLFAEILERARLVTVERDAKLAELKQVLRNKIEAPTRDKDGRLNRKVLIFTTFSDTAGYLYDNLQRWANGELGVHIALITGSGGNRSSTGESEFVEILARFAPRAQQARDDRAEVDILIATDCLSEGQNLQDCDLVVNYDIHWNPVRLMQRFGRIDRLGSRSYRVAMVNFWPTVDLDRYLDLKNRVEARMALADATATGLDNLLNYDEVDAAGNALQGELAFRDQQLTRMRDEILDVEEAEGSVTLSDLTLDDFLADLLNYIQQNRAALESAPLGIRATVAGNRKSGIALKREIQPVFKGVIFCLRRSGTLATRPVSRLWPYFLVYVRDDGAVQYSFRQAKQCLALFRSLAEGQPSAIVALEDAFDQETDHGQRMEKYDTLLEVALQNIAETFKNLELRELTRDRGAVLAKLSERPERADDFELITWLVVSDKLGVT